LRSVQQLYIVDSTGEYGASFTITARNPTADPTTTGPYINVDEVEHIFYGNVFSPLTTCEQLLFGYEFISNTTSANKKDYTVYLKPNVMNLMPNYVNYQKLQISITSNNSLTINIQDTILPTNIE
jgi:hypothetical protein